MLDIQEAIRVFRSAVSAAEVRRDVEPLMGLFSADAEIGSVGLLQPCCGPQSVRAFWMEYLRMFGQIETQFVHVHGAGDLAVLEWRSMGVLGSGERISYSGVTILEYHNGLIGRFRTYYDSAAFIPDHVKLLGREELSRRLASPAI